MWYLYEIMKHYKFKLFFLLIVISCEAYTQSGCTDPQALNYNAGAIVNDGSCLYDVTDYPPVLLGDLPSLLNETSGLIYWNEKLVTFNDSGGANKIYLIDTSGVSVVQEITISNAQNIDWEAIAQSSDSIYVGDFGNNAGSRQNLCIYGISKSDILLTTNNSVVGVKSEFNYSDQVVFSGQYENHNYDCEAFFYHNDSLHLFTKNWSDLYTKHYVLPSSNQNVFSASVKDSFFVDGLITDASLDSINNRLLLLGYKNNGSNFYTSFVYLLFDYSSNNYFSGNKRRIEIGSMLEVSQTEGIAWSDSLTGYISAEEIVSVITIAPKLFSFDFSTYLSNSLSETDELEESYWLSPNPVIESLLLPEDVKAYSIVSQSGQVIVERIDYITNNLIDVKFLKAGKYFLKDLNNNRVYKFVKLDY